MPGHIYIVYRLKLLFVLPLHNIVIAISFNSFMYEIYTLEFYMLYIYTVVQHDHQHYLVHTTQVSSLSLQGIN